ncbi:MAG: nucleotide exchange factor GrpE [Candidatus Tectomicrobia bacterium]|uniref:Protein GrpE n=1 Tax=Tectimicrobiota bacterium TaxID=2528274 RepID=A0A938B306_UNCTE|nr:nucleotide exchange factor GrpE [Candidatus Tectomicrobia bacterium]
MEMRDQQGASEEDATHASGAGTAQEATPQSDDTTTEEAQGLTIEALQEQLAQQSRKAEEQLDQLQRLQADFQNYRRRMTQERLEAAGRGKEDVLRGLIPVLNNFRLALQHVEQDPSAVRQGVQMIWQQFEGFLRDQKVEPIPTVGHVFDPAYHEVLSTVPATADAPANTIVTEVKAGYCIDGRLLAPAQVIVTRATESASTEPSTSTEAAGVEVSEG